MPTINLPIIDLLVFRPLVTISPHAAAAKVKLLAWRSRPQPSLWYGAQSIVIFLRILKIV